MGRALRLAVSLLVVAAALTAITLVTARPGDPTLFPPAPGAPQVVVFVSHNGYHAELALPTATVRRHGGASAAALDQLSAAPWVLVGWGDARFYRGTGWSMERFADGLRALGPGNRSVLRLTPLDRDPDEAFASGILRIALSERGAERLLRRLDRSFRTMGGRPIPVPAPQQQRPAVYFESVERFSIGKLCNNWSGELLNAAGVPTTPALHALPQGLMWDVRSRLNGAQDRERR